MPAPRRTLRDIIDEVPPTNPDAIADSCSEASDDYQPLTSIALARGPSEFQSDNNDTPQNRTRGANEVTPTIWAEQTKRENAPQTLPEHYYAVQW